MWTSNLCEGWVRWGGGGGGWWSWGHFGGRGRGVFGKGGGGGRGEREIHNYACMHICVCMCQCIYVCIFKCFGMKINKTSDFSLLRKIHLFAHLLHDKSLNWTFTKDKNCPTMCNCKIRNKMKKKDKIIHWPTNSHPKCWTNFGLKQWNRRITKEQIFNWSIFATLTGLLGSHLFYMINHSKSCGNFRPLYNRLDCTSSQFFVTIWLSVKVKVISNWSQHVEYGCIRHHTKVERKWFISVQTKVSVRVIFYKIYISRVLSLEYKLCKTYLARTSANQQVVAVC